ncbi:MAG: hypothetical protein P8Y70_02840 [Candidatus Lokiarchaeota archaeon]
MLLLLIGSILSDKYVIEGLGINFNIVGFILRLISLLIFSYFSLVLPPFQEIGWKGYIEDIYLINSYGACIFYNSYKFKNSTIEKQVVSGAITSINVMLAKLSQLEQKGISIIEKEGKIIYFYTSKRLTCVLFSREEFGVIKLNLKRFVEYVEDIYDKILDSWDGTLDIFTPIGEIADKFFKEK